MGLFNRLRMKNEAPQAKSKAVMAMAMFFLNLYHNGYWISQLFFGAWLLPLGYLVFKSGFLPRILGVVMMVHCAGWLMTFLQFFLFPGLVAITYLTYPLGFISEFALTLWLLIMGARDQMPAAVEGRLSMSGS